jgi:integrase
MPRRPQVRYYPSRGAYYYQVDGVKHRLAAGPDDRPSGPTFLAALDRYKQLLEAGAVGTAGDANTVRVVLDAFLQAAERRVRPRTFQLKLTACKLFCKKWGDLRVSEVKPWHAEQVALEMRKERTYSDPNRKGQWTFRWGSASEMLFYLHVSSGFNWAVRQRLITHNPLKGLDLPKARTRSRERIVTPEQHALVLGELSSPRQRPLRDFVVALEATGARPGELRNATVGDFDPALKAIVYYGDDKRREDEFRHKTSARKDRIVYLTGEALELVRARVAGGRRSDLLFPNSQGRPYTAKAIEGCFRTLRGRLGLPGYVAYSYRHSFATNWLLGGGKIEVLAELLGNTPATILKHYSHICRQHDALRAELERFKAREGT